MTRGVRRTRRGVSGRWVIIPLAVVTAIILAVFITIRRSGRGAAEENYLLLSYTQALRDLDEGFYQLAVKRFTPVIEAGGRPAAWGFRGEAYLRLEEFERAESDFREAIRREPDRSANYAGLAASLAGLGRHREALAAIDQAIDQAIETFSPPNASERDKPVPRTGDTREELESLRAEYAAVVNSE